MTAKLEQLIREYGQIGTDSSNMLIQQHYYRLKIEHNKEILVSKPTLEEDYVWVLTAHSWEYYEGEDHAVIACSFYLDDLLDKAMQMCSKPVHESFIVLRHKTNRYCEDLRLVLEQMPLL